uniref:Cytochrome b n=1 Tax=Ettchellsia sinica TaxID=1738633 RepID=A0A2S0AYE0_9HYME|nr:cytochrome b [Ettchellsia sinica]
MSFKLLKNLFSLGMMMLKLYKGVIYLPTPVNISIWWNFGSMLGLMLLNQIISGLFLSMHYCPNIDMAFISVIHIMQDVKYGWEMRWIHSNGASIYFIFMYIHIFRGLYYGSYNFMKPWGVGVLILLISMATAFVGYVLPWGQMSFWGATVITNLMSAIPYLGLMIVKWLWGGFSINNATLNRFYSFHFILPIIIMFMVLIHLYFLHETGSSNPMGVGSDYYKIYFHMYFSWKDLIGFIIMFFMILILVFMYPFSLGDPDNFIMANPMVTPIHIKPEWYFLFAYAILRSIPNKLSGVLALLMSILVLLMLIFIDIGLFKSLKFYPLSQIYYWLFLNICILLTWVGGMPIEWPYEMLGQILSVMYFMYFMLNMMLMKLWDKIIFKY